MNRKKMYILIGVVVILAIGVIFVSGMKIETITYEGNVRVSEEELNNHIFGEDYGKNTVIFKLKSIFGDKAQIPFVEDYDIEMQSMSSIKITVYEKSIVGYIYYMGTYMYFDKDGIVVESSASQLENIPEVTGIDFDNIVLHETIPVENQNVFGIILDITQLVEKYDIKVKRVHISDLQEVTLYISNFRVALGNEGKYGEKIATLSDIIPSMQDIPGELNMKEYDTNSKGYIFKKD